MKRMGATRCASGLVATALMTAPLSALANAPTWGPVTLLNSNGIIDSSGNAAPTMATDNRGTWLAFWYATGVIRMNRSDVVFARSTTNGTTWSSPAALNPTAAMGNGNNDLPQVATDGRNLWIVIWASNDTLGGTLPTANLRIFISRSTNNGINWSAPATLSPNAASETGVHYSPRLATDRSGNWIAVWVTNEQTIGGRPGLFQVVFARSTDNGATWSNAAALDTMVASNTDSSFAPDVAPDGHGNWIAVWDTQEPRFGARPGERDIGFTVSTNNGMTWAPSRALNTDAPTDTANDFEPRISTDAHGVWLAVWYANNIGGPWGNDYDACVAKSVDNGTTWSDRAPLNSDAYVDGPAQADQRPMVLYDGGNWVAVWDKVGTNFRNIMTATSTTSGRTWTRLVTLNANASTTNGDSVQPWMATDGAGHWNAVWRSNDQLQGMVPRQHYNIFNALGTYICGDGVVDPGEQCDNGRLNGTPGNCCDAMCHAAPPNTSCVGPFPGACNTNQCNATGTCVSVMIPLCCMRDDMCMPAATCFMPPHCNAMTSRCEYMPIQGCCTMDMQCTDPNICNLSTCNQMTHTCQTTPIANCCTTGAQCDDGNPCHQNTCNTMNRCDHTPIPNCPPMPDAGFPDTGVDTGVAADTGQPGQSDSGVVDGAVVSRDATGSGAGTPPASQSGCGCDLAGESAPIGRAASATILGAMALLWLGGRRRRR